MLAPHSVFDLQAQVSSVHSKNAHFSQAVAVALCAHTMPPSPEEPPEPPVEPPVPVAVLELDEPAEPELVLEALLVAPPSGPPSVTSTLHAPRIPITKDAAAQPVMFFIVSLLAIGYSKKLKHAPRSGAGPRDARSLPPPCEGAGSIS